MPATLWLSWREDVSLSPGDGEATVEGRSGKLALRPLPREILDAMERLASPGAEEDGLADSVLHRGGPGSLARWFYHVEQLQQRGFVKRTLRLGEMPLATVTSLGRKTPENARNGVDPGSKVMTLSRFACLRRMEQDWVLESPLSPYRVTFNDSRAVSAVSTLGRNVTLEEMETRVSDLPETTVKELARLLGEAGMLAAVDDDGNVQEPVRGLEAWEFHDLLFHSRSRRGRWDGGCGGTFRLAHLPPPPALVDPDDTDGACKFETPDLSQLERDDPPFSKVQNERRSIREYADPPLSARQLGEFLFRVGRVTERWESEFSTSAGPIVMDFASRPYPGAGALYELDLFVVVNRCLDLAPGLYRYDASRHLLAPVEATMKEVDLLLTEAAGSAGMAADSLQVLIVIAARFERVAWKYESIAYALILKDAGALIQTMYLAATAMGLAPCALGCGDSDQFARAAGTNYYVKTSVGEFLLGSKA